ncbi:MAG: GTP 3',8-cyclase MoaA [Planctomycetes bacterium]|nr:GTP 3',8-cyclase MoaA [Planctomycetota bacterium]
MVPGPMPRLPDRLGRPLRNLRLSVTDRCNLRCQYCMPEAEYAWLPKANVLTYEEMLRLVRVFVQLGVDKVRLTGGEPLLRSDVTVLVRMLAALPELRELAMTTNGILLADKAAALREAGLQRITVSLDTLDAATFRLLARRDDLQRTLAGIDAARAAGFEDIKLDTVVIAGVNDGELGALLDYARSVGVEIRFIEYMDVGGATHWSPERVVSRARILEAIGRSHGAITPLPRTDSAPAERFRLGDGTHFGVISSVTQPFCATCDRARLTADGMWFTCLYASEGTNLRDVLRRGASDEELLAQLRSVWIARRDRGAEERVGTPDRRPLADSAALRQNPHLEMHKRGG